MGRDKAWLPWRGRPVLEHVVEQLAAAVDEVLVVSAPGQTLPEIPARRVEDHQEGLGPLAGLAAGLAACKPGLSFVTASDAPFLSAAFIGALLAPGTAAAPADGERVHPLSGAYPVEAAKAAQDLLDQGRRRPLDLLEYSRFKALPLSSLPDAQAIAGFNTPSEYLAAARADTPDGVARVALVSPERSTPERTREVAMGSLAEVLEAAQGATRWAEGERLAPGHRVALPGHADMRDLRVPIGAGEEIRVFEAGKNA
jgi:molybdenum cofactor guanylyltransferase